MMNMTEPLLLPPDVILKPVAELPEEVRRQFEAEEGDYALTRPGTRAPSRIVDAPSAALLGEFQQARTIVEAVWRFSRERAADPQQTLDAAFPLLVGLVRSGFLVAEGAEDAAGIKPALAAGAEVAGWSVVDCVQVLDDTELYQVRGAAGRAALKIERPGAAGRSAGLLAREGAILDHLAAAGIAPPRLALGEHEGRRYLAVGWCPGVDAATAATELRREAAAGSEESRRELLALLVAVAEAYAALHARGVAHADVHPRNILVAAGGAVRLIDFGLARWEGAPEGTPRAWRGGIAFFYEPEYAAAAAAGQRPPEATPAGEQYSVAALLYLMATGAHYRDFSLERGELLRQIAGEPPLPFAERGVEPWPEVEVALGRALAKDPRQRYASVADLAGALRAALAQAAAWPAGARPAADLAPAEALLARVLERTGRAGALLAQGLPEAPRASLNFGAAGIAYALYRIALAREDADLLGTAELWALRAAADGAAAGGFENQEMETSPAMVERFSPYHRASGVAAVQALIAHAQGEIAAQVAAVAAFLGEVRQRCGEPGAGPDLTLGRCGAVLAAAQLLDTLDEETAGPLVAELSATGDEILAGLWREIDELPEIACAVEGPDPWVNLGMAHGWAGYLYATLRWCRAARRRRPAGLAARLAQLAGLAEPWGRGARWRWYSGEVGAGGRREGGAMSGWCNGSAGFVHLWTLADRELGGGFGALAEAAAWHAWEEESGGGSLCCGLAGRAYALLNLYRHTGEGRWLDRARSLAVRAAVEIERASERQDSLYKGLPGVAVLAADLARPEQAAMPFFEDEGWRA